MTNRVPVSMCVIMLCIAVAVSAPARAGILTLTFESLNEGEILDTQFAPLGVTVAGNPMVLTAGSLLNEIDFPPRSGNNVLTDATGPITFNFTPFGALSVSGYLTYNTTLTFQVFSATNVLLDSKLSSATANLGAQELVGFSGVGDIASLVITGDLAGQSFTLDDITFETPVPEPQTYVLILSVLSLLAGIARYRDRIADRG